MSESILGETRAPQAAAPAARLGGELRAAREKLGWELADLARSLRIRQSYLEAIEAGRMSDLPGTTYALGFVRAYASALGLPGEKVASRFRAESGQANVRPALSFPAPVPQRGVPAGALMLLGLVVLAGTYSGWYYVSERQRTPPETVPPIPDQLLQPAQQKPPPSPQVATILPTASPPTPEQAPAVQQAPQGPGTAASPAPGSPAAATPAPLPNVQAPGAAAPIIQMPPPTTLPAAQAAVPPPQAVPPGTRIVVKATADAWVTVKPKGGGPVFNKLMHAGDVWPVPADKPNLLLTTGNAGGTEIDLDGAPIPGLGGSGMVRHDVPLDAETLKSGLPPLPSRPHPKPSADG